MNEKELTENIENIKQLFKSDKLEAGFELIRTLNKPELNEALARPRNV